MNSIELDKIELDDIVMFAAYELGMSGVKNMYDLIYHASAEGNHKILRYLQKNNVNILKHGAQAPLEKSVECGAFRTFKYLIDAGANVHDIKSFIMRTASYIGNYKMISYMIQIKAHECHGDESLFWSIHNEHHAVTRLLISKGGFTKWGQAARLEKKMADEMDSMIELYDKYKKIFARYINTHLVDIITTYI